MNLTRFLLPFAMFVLSAPALATGGLHCRTAGANPIDITLGFGHVPSAGLFLARLTDTGRDVPVEATQWWMRDTELRLALVSRDALEEEAILIASWNRETSSYDGSIRRKGEQRWIRCREA